MKTVYNKMMKHYYIYCKIQLTDASNWWIQWLNGWLLSNHTFEPFIYVIITFFSSRNNIILEKCVELSKKSTN